VSDQWRDMSEMPRDASEFSARLRDGSVVVAHYACGGGEDQPRFEGVFTWRGTYYAPVDAVGWCPLDKKTPGGRR
jgi:hypothetical protein